MHPASVQEGESPARIKHVNPTPNDDDTFAAVARRNVFLSCCPPGTDESCAARSWYLTGVGRHHRPRGCSDHIDMGSATRCAEAGADGAIAMAIANAIRLMGVLRTNELSVAARSNAERQR